ncbi:MAG: MucR family transcriptional regulator [Magnetococcales bacterium]|nr:MucR family transcriptional regulator [Magnetococcales bacterium]
MGHRNPELIEEWNYAKNGSLTPFDVTFGSDQKVWWICKSGHEWQAIINNRVQKKGCPYCSGRLVTEEKSLAVRFPYLIEEWNTQRNGGLSSFEVSAKSPKRRWWKCSFGHEWESSPYERASMKMCPYCSGQRPSDDNNIGILFPNLKKEWHQTKNGSLTPTQVTSGSGRRVWWICREGHEWQAIIANRVRGTNCPHCHQSKRQLSTRPRSNFLDIIQKQHDQVDLNQFHEQRIRDKEESASDFLYKAALVKSVEVINSLRGRLKEHENRLTHGETIEREFRVTTQDRIKLRKEVSRFKKQLQQRTRERDGVREELEGTKRILRKTSSDLEKVSGLYEESTETIRKKNGKIQELRQHFKSLSKEVRTTAVCESDFQGDQAGYDFSRLARKVTPDLPINPVIPVEESFGEEGIVCLVCGVQLPALVWHLKVSHGMTPDFYRNHFDLPDNFPLQVDVRPDISNKSVEGP